MKHEVALEIFLREQCLSTPAALNPGCLLTASGWEAELRWCWRNYFVLNRDRNTRFSWHLHLHSHCRVPLGLGQALSDQVKLCDPQNSQESLTGCPGKWWQHRAWQNFNNTLRHKVWLLECSVQDQLDSMIFVHPFQPSRSCDSVIPTQC